MENEKELIKWLKERPQYFINRTTDEILSDYSEHINSSQIDVETLGSNEHQKRICPNCKYCLPEDRCSHPQGCESDYELWEQL